MSLAVVVNFLSGKLIDESFGKIKDVFSSKIDKKQFDNQKNELIEKIDKMVVQIDDIRYGGALYSYIYNNKIIEKILGNWLKVSTYSVSDDEIRKQSIAYIESEGISLSHTDKSNIESFINGIYKEVEKFFINNISQDNAIIINALVNMLANAFENELNTLRQRIDEIKNILVKEESDSIELVSEITKNKFAERFLGKELFYEPSDKKPITIKEMYIEPTIRICKGNSVHDDKEYVNVSGNMRVDSLIDAFAEHKNKNDFLNKLSINDENNKMINNIFNCFDDKKGIYDDEKEKFPYKKILFIYGDAGTGKSTFIYKKCNDYKNINNNMYFLSMKDLIINIEKEILKYKFKDINHIEVETEFNFNNIKENSVLYLDGFDESSHANDIIKLIYKKTRKSDLKIIVTSRIDYKVDNDLDKQTMYSKINFFSYYNIASYVDTYFNYYGVKDTNNYNNFIKHIYKTMKAEMDCKGESTDKNSEHFSMYKIPIILYLFSNDIVCETLRNPNKLFQFEISSRYGVYKRLFGEGGHIYRDGKKKYQIKKIQDTLKNIAFEMFRQRKLNIVINKQELVKDFDMKFDIVENNRIGAGEFYMNVNGKTNELSCEFYHKSFYEYFVAEKMADIIVHYLKEYNTKKMQNEDIENTEKNLNAYFGLNQITKEIYYFLEQIIRDKYSECDHEDNENDAELNVIRNNFFGDEINVQNEFVKFFRCFISRMCIPRDIDNKYLQFDDGSPVVDTIMSNTFSNVTTILLRILRNSNIYMDSVLSKDEGRRGINIFGIDKNTSSNQLSKIRNLIFLKSFQNLPKFFDDISFYKVDINLYGFYGTDYCLSYSNLSYNHLNYANFAFSNLMNANLIKTYFRGGLFVGANLEGANLEGADLEGANLEGANLEGVNLKNANLRGADLKGADLTDINLKGAVLVRTRMLDTDIEKYGLNKDNLIKRGIWNSQY